MEIYGFEIFEQLYENSELRDLEEKEDIEIFIDLLERALKFDSQERATLESLSTMPFLEKYLNNNSIEKSFSILPQKWKSHKLLVANHFKEMVSCSSNQKPKKKMKICASFTPNKGSDSHTTEKIQSDITMINSFGSEPN